MKKDALKSTLLPFFLCIAGNTIALSSDVQHKNIVLYAKLIAELGPERAGQFKERLEKKHAKPTVTKPTQPIKPPVTPPTPPQKPVVQTPPVTIQPPMAPPVPQTKEWLSAGEKEAFITILDKLKTYTARVNECVNEFFNKNNNEPYRTHVMCFKTQLKFLQEHLRNFPQPQSPAGTILFNSLKTLAIALERSQDLMCQTLDQDYPNMVGNVVVLGLKLKSLDTATNPQRNIINQQIGVLRNELRKAHANDMLLQINQLNTTISATFDYHKNKNMNELTFALMHRVKK